MTKTPFSTWNPEGSPTHHEVFRDFGFAAFTAQMLEASMITILLAAEYAGKTEINKPKKRKDIESEIFLSEQTLGKLIALLKEGGIDESLTDIIDDALKARNYLMHHFYVWNAKNYLTEEGRGLMLKELQQLQFRIGRSQIAFSQIREQFVEKLFGISEADLKRLYDERVFQDYQGEAGSSEDNRLPN